MLVESVNLDGNAKYDDVWSNTNLHSKLYCSYTQGDMDVVSNVCSNTSLHSKLLLHTR